MKLLDDTAVIKQRDPQDALGVAANQVNYFNATFEATFTPTTDVRSIVWAGMGGSALPMVVVGSWPKLKLPFEIVRDYSIPHYVDESTLFIASSYSGNTEETLSALEAAENAGAQIVIVAAGGKLKEIAEQKNYPLFSIPAGIQPRMATFYFVKAFLSIIEPLQVTVADANEINSIAPWLEQVIADFKPEVPTADNLAKQIAVQLMGKTVITYAGPALFPVANKWKICMNENAKNTAWTNQYPEFNHNEFIGWSSHPVEKPFGVVEIRSSLEHPRIEKRMAVSERLLSGMRPHPIAVEMKGDTLLQQLAYGFVLGDYVSIYLAFLNGVNPTPVDLVEKLKKELG